MEFNKFSDKLIVKELEKNEYFVDYKYKINSIEDGKKKYLLFLKVNVLGAYFYSKTLINSDQVTFEELEDFINISVARFNNTIKRGIDTSFIAFQFIFHYEFNNDLEYNDPDSNSLFYIVDTIDMPFNVENFNDIIYAVDTKYKECIN